MMTVAGGVSSAVRDSGVPVWRRRPTMQSVLLASLVLTAGVWVSAGYYFVQRIRVLEREGQGVSERYAAAEAALGAVRRDLDRATSSLRDALIDVQLGANRDQTDVNAALDAAEANLAAYAPVPGVDTDRQHIDGLRRNIDALRAAYHEFLATDAGQPRAKAAARMLDDVTPKRDAVLRVSNDLQRLNRDAFLAHQAEMSRVHGAMHTRSWQTLIFCAVFGLAIGLAAALRVGRLERALRARQQHDVANAVLLRELSTRLVGAQEAERQHIARELHDGVGQLLTALKLELSQADRRVSGTVPLGDARALADEALVAVRDVSHLLHPPELYQLGLTEAIEAYVRAIRRRQHVEIEFTAAVFEPRLPSTLELAVYRIVQEAVTNVLRHAHARHCRVSLSAGTRTIVLSIEDDGIGFDAAPRPGIQRPGLGLTGIRERVLYAGGTLQVQTAPGHGTTLRAEFPLPGDESDAAVGGAPALASAHPG